MLSLIYRLLGIEEQPTRRVKYDPTPGYRDDDWWREHFPATRDDESLPEWRKRAKAKDLTGGMR